MRLTPTLATVVIFLAILIGFGWSLSQSFFATKNSDVALESSTNLQSETNYQQTLNALKSIQFEDKTYRYQWHTVRDLAKLDLYPNFEWQAYTSDLYPDYQCTFLVNGGFYDTQGNPLGLLVSDGKLITYQLRSTLFDGFLSLSSDNLPVIATVPPPAETVWAVQTGPLLRLDNQPTSLKLTEDEEDRRMVGAINANNQLLFFVITADQSLAKGPLLAKLPSVIEVINQKEQLQLVSAVNLDGGSASAFLTPNLKIEEWNWIGSFMCEKE